MFWILVRLLPLLWEVKIVKIPGTKRRVRYSWYVSFMASREGGGKTSNQVMWLCRKVLCSRQSQPLIIYYMVHQT